MSYCRWSSDDYQCDVYVWHDVNGTWRTEVAGRRPVLPEGMPEPVRALPIGADRDQVNEWVSAWTERDIKVRALLGDSDEWTYLELPTPEGGNSYEHATPDDCADNLERLRAAGLNVPQYAIDSLREEAAE